MVVTGIVPGTNTLPSTLAANTIYVLEPWVYITTGSISMATCSSIVWKWEVEIRWDFATNTRLFLSSSKNNWILDNLSLNRNRGSNTGTTVDVVSIANSSSLTLNRVKTYSGYVGMNVYSQSNYVTINNSESYDNAFYGIWFYNSMSYGKINNSSVYNNSNYGIMFQTSANSWEINNTKIYNNTLWWVYIASSSLYAQINNSQMYNNTGNGVYVYNNAHYTQINNSQIYNNSANGVYSRIVNNTQINDSQIYNNNAAWIYFRESNNGQVNNSQIYNNNTFWVMFSISNYGVINNSQVYNNDQGIQYSDSSSFWVINNCQLYNQKKQWINYSSWSNNVVYNTYIYNQSSAFVGNMVWSENNRYYGNIYVFGNASNNVWGTYSQWFFTGDDGFMWRENGTKNLLSMSWDYITNPVNLSGEFFLWRTGTMSSLKERKITTMFDKEMQYSYWSGILLQTQPVQYNGTTLVASGIYDEKKYIWSNTSRTIWDIIGINQFNRSNTIVTWIAHWPISSYSLYGDIQNSIENIPIYTPATVFFTTGNETNTIITQLYNTGEYFATHFQKKTTLDDVAPSIPTLLLPTQESIITWNTILFSRNSSTDTGAGLSGYLYQISTNSWFTTFFASWATSQTGILLTGFVDGTYYRRVAAYDAVGNIWNRSSVNNFVREWIVILPPQVGTAYISSGTTGDNGGMNYYKWTIDVRAYLSWSTISTCEYTTWTTRASADIQAWYCEVQNLSFNNDIVVQFRASNQWGTTIWGSTTYIYDAAPPSWGTFTINNNAAYTTGIDIVLTTSCATDTGINGTQVAFGYTSSPTNRQSCSSNLSRTLPSGDGTKTVYMRFKDGFENISEVINDTIILDTSWPSSPTLLSPVNGSSSTTGTIDLLRSESVDVGVWLSGYLWQLSTGSNFATVITWWFTTMTGTTLSGLPTTSYYRRVYSLDLLGNMGSRTSSRFFSIIPVISFAIESPASLDLGSLATPEDTQIVEKIFTGSENYFTLADYVGDDQWYYTTLSMTNMTNGNGALLSNQNIAIKTATNIVTIAWASNPNVVSAITWVYKTFGNDVLTFIKRDPWSNGWLIGTYWVSPALKVTIPQLQNSWNYSGTLIYTIYPN